MHKVIAVVLVLSVAFGCGQVCDDAAIEADGVAECVASNRPAGYCACFVQHVMGRHTCSAIEKSDVPLKDITEACNACAPQYGGTCS